MSLRESLRLAVTALTLLAFTGCTTLRPIPDFTPSKIRDQVEVGDHVSIAATNGQTYDLEVTKVEADALYGYTKDHAHHYKVPFESIQSIQVEKFSGGKFWTGFGAVVTVGVIVFIIALLRGLHDSGASCDCSSSSGED